MYTLLLSNWWSLILYHTTAPMSTDNDEIEGIISLSLSLSLSLSKASLFSWKRKNYLNIFYTFYTWPIWQDNFSFLKKGREAFFKTTTDNILFFLQKKIKNNDTHRTWTFWLLMNEMMRPILWKYVTDLHWDIVNWVKKENFLK